MAALPVNLLSFIGQYTNNLVKLNWSTAQEQQNKMFEVQYSSNGYAFETIGTVPGNMNSNQVNNYQFNTTHYQPGKNFYRLKQVDVDGRSTISSIATILIDQQMVISLAPNPASTKLNLSVYQPVSWQVVININHSRRGSRFGLLCLLLKLSFNTVVVHLPALTKGVYVWPLPRTAKSEKLFINKVGDSVRRRHKGNQAQRKQDKAQLVLHSMPCFALLP